RLAREPPDPDALADLGEERLAHGARLLGARAQQLLDLARRGDQPLVLGPRGLELRVDPLEQELLHLAPADARRVTLADRRRFSWRRERAVDRVERAVLGVLRRAGLEGARLDLHHELAQRLRVGEQRYHVAVALRHLAAV